jgi:hypothetical protein
MLCMHRVVHKHSAAQAAVDVASFRNRSGRRLCAGDQPHDHALHYMTLNHMLHSKQGWEPLADANGRLIGGRDIIKDLIVIRDMHNELFKCGGRLQSYLVNRGLLNTVHSCCRRC